MKKLLLLTVVLGGAVVFTSCSKDECECTVAGTTTTTTEDDMPDSATGSLSDYCTAADAFLTSPDQCKMK